MAEDMEDMDDADDKATPGTPSPSAFWQNQIALAEKDHRDFWQDGQKFEERYKSERTTQGKKAWRGKRFNIVYSNTEVIRSTIYARAARPDVRQRWSQAGDKKARVIADMTERALSYSIDTTTHEKQFKNGVLDLAIAGRGIVKMCYEPVMGKGDDEEEYITDQKMYVEHVYYKDWLHSPCKSWSELWWMAFRKVMSKDDLEEYFPDAKIGAIPLDWVPEGTDKNHAPDEVRRAEVWEIWNKITKQRLWVVKGYPHILRSDDDPYQLEGFWPMAEPVQAIRTNSTFVPRSQIVAYEDQADDLDETTDRISKLTRELKRRGAYDASIKELKQLARAGDNVFIPIENWSAFLQGGGLKGAFQTEDPQQFSNPLMAAYQARDMLVQTIYEVTGISDIMRGSSQASETATAQQIKASMGSVRVKDLQQDVQRWVRDTLRIMAELMAEHFEPQVLMEMTGIKLPSRAEVQQQLMQAQMQAMQSGQPFQPPAEMPLTIDDVMETLRNDKMRSYIVDIESDSTVFEDAEQEKADRVELLQSISQFVGNWMQVAQVGGPPMMKLGMEMLGFGVRGFKAGRSMEDAIDEARQAIEQMAQQPEQPPPPDPAIEREKMKMEADKARAEADLQLKQLDLQLKQAELQGKGLDNEIKREQLGLDAEAKALEREHKRQIMEMELTGKQLALDFDARAKEADYAGRQRMMDLEYAGKIADRQMKDDERAAGEASKAEDRARADRPRRVQFERGPDGRIIGGSLSS
jgi:hypothetical protein